MDALWKSNVGKLFVGGCGAQVGMVLTCGLLTVTVLFGFICIVSNAIAIGVAQQVTQESSGAVAVAAPTPANIPIEISIPVQQAPAVAQPAQPAGIAPAQAPSNPQEVQLLEELERLLKEVETYRTQQPAASNNSTGNLPQPVLVASQSGVDLMSGPGKDYNRVAHLPIGQSLEIVGRNPDSSWWLVSTPQGAFAWVSARNVATFNASEAIPVVTIPALLVHPAAASVSVASSGPGGTPTPTIDTEREYVENMPAYKRLRGHLLVPPVSESVSPDGSQVAITERIKLYTLGTEGALTKIWFEDDDKMGPIGGAVWSPDGRYVAFVVGFKTKYCRPCRAVALLYPAQETITFLEPPRSDLDTDMPRWTQDGRLMVNAHPGEPADGVAYVYDVSGHFEEAEGLYELSSSHEGQKWYPWLPGRTWRAGVSERADSYNSD